MKEQSHSSALYLDVIVNGAFYRQLRYDGKPHKDIIAVKMTDVYDSEPLNEFVLEKLPSLKNREFSIYPTEQRV